MRSKFWLIASFLKCSVGGAELLSRMYTGAVQHSIDASKTALCLCIFAYTKTRMESELTYHTNIRSTVCRGPYNRGYAMEVEQSCFNHASLKCPNSVGIYRTPVFETNVVNLHTVRKVRKLRPSIHTSTFSTSLGFFFSHPDCESKSVKVRIHNFSLTSVHFCLSDSFWSW